MSPKDATTFNACMLKLAAVTMVYNESDFLPIWLRHYTNIVGIRNCFVVDHGSTDGSTSDLTGAGYVPLPRSRMDDRLRAEFISTFCSNLLRYYDWVLYVDVDELLVPDPKVYSSIVDLCERTEHNVIRCVGLNVHQVPGDVALDVNQPVTLQRRFARLALSMCKPSLTRVSIKWTPGFHSADVDSSFDHLFLFHLAPADLHINMKKLTRTRSMPWAEGVAGSHQRVSDQDRMHQLKSIGTLPKHCDMTFDETDAEFCANIKTIDRFIAENPAERHSFYSQLSKSCRQNELWEIPTRFRGSA